MTIGLFCLTWMSLCVCLCVCLWSACLVIYVIVGCYSIYVCASSNTPPQTQRIPAIQTSLLLLLQQPGLSDQCSKQQDIIPCPDHLTSVVPQEQNLVVLIHTGLPVVSAQRAVHWRKCLYRSEWCTEWFRAPSGVTSGGGDYDSRHLETCRK